MKKTLDDHLTSYYTDKKISPQRRRELLAIIAGDGKESFVTIPALARLWQSGKIFLPVEKFAYASVLVVLGSLIGMIIFGLPDRFQQDELIAAISREITMNHRKNFDVEFGSQSLTVLNEQMKLLDFTLLMPRKISQSLTISGARYCSIGGRIAAQIQLTDSKGSYYTLYQTRLVEPLSNIEDVSLKGDGVESSLWHEGAVFFGFVRSSN